jgi:hypothetical protein
MEVLRGNARPILGLDFRMAWTSAKLRSHFFHGVFGQQPCVLRPHSTRSVHDEGESVIVQADSLAYFPAKVDLGGSPNTQHKRRHAFGVMTDYSRQWQSYRRLRNAAGAILIFGLLLGAITVLLRSFQASEAVLLLAVSILAVIVLPAGIVTAIRVENWRCPRCGRAFVSKWQSRFLVFLLAECANCGLRKWSNG